MVYYINRASQKNHPTIAEICVSLGIKVFLDTDNVCLDNFTRGIAYIRDKQYRIMLNKKQSLKELQLTACHELAHILLGHLLPSYVGSPEQRELEVESLRYIIYSYIYNQFYAAEKKSVKEFCNEVKQQECTQKETA